MPRKAAPKSRKVGNKKKKRASWKNTGKKRVFKSRLKKILSVSALFLFSLCFLSIYTVYKVITTPFASASDEVYSRSFGSSKIFTVLVASVESLNERPLKTKNLAMIFANTETEEIFVFEIDPEYKIDLPGRFGTEEVSKVLALSEFSGESAQKTFEKLFAHRIDRYILFDNKLHDTLYPFLTRGECDGVMRFSTLREMVSSLDTSFSFSEYYDFYRFYKTVNSTNIHQMSMEGVDDSIREINFESNVALERKSIAVLNGTSVSGLAAYGSRAIENMGGRIISMGNTTENFENSVIVTDDMESETFKEIVTFFNIKNVLPKESALFIDESEVNRADITVIFGFDISGGM